MIPLQTKQNLKKLWRQRDTSQPLNKRLPMEFSKKLSKSSLTQRNFHLKSVLKMWTNHLGLARSNLYEAAKTKKLTLLPLGDDQAAVTHSKQSKETRK